MMRCGNRVLFILLLCFFATHLNSDSPPVKNEKQMKLNTSNPGKFIEFKQIFAKYGYRLDSSAIDLREIDADPLSVVAHKASQVGEGVIIEDTSLDIEGAKVGVNVRWLLDHLSELTGRKAEWVVLLAYRKGEDIYIFKGEIKGTIVQPQGKEGFGFDPVFLPAGSTKTLAEEKPDVVNARAKAVDALINQRVYTVKPAIKDWNGPWQH